MTSKVDSPINIAFNSKMVYIQRIQLNENKIYIFVYQGFGIEDKSIIL